MAESFDYDYQRMVIATLAGQPRPTRAVLRSTGQPVGARTVIGTHLVTDLSAGLPLLTLRSIHWRSVVAELLWFCSGSTNAADLRALGSTIWDEWARDDGDLGPVYGAQWRAFHGRDGRVVDQVDQLVTNLRAVAADPAHPAARRLLLTGLNPADATVAALPPCHVLAQWDVDPIHGTLTCIVTQRSADLYLGVPYNVASYALMTWLLAQMTSLRPGRLIFNFGNLHLYDNHVEAARMLLTREPAHSLPQVRIGSGPVAMPCVDWRRERGFVVRPYGGSGGESEALRPEDVRLIGYAPGPALPGEVAV
jgi:thymidylate synthase